MKFRPPRIYRPHSHQPQQPQFRDRKGKVSQLTVLKDRAHKEGWDDATCVCCQHYEHNVCALQPDVAQSEFGICLEWEGLEDSDQSALAF